MANIVMFVILAVVVLGSAILSVCTKSIMRAATFLLFVLFGIAGFYFLLDYTFLGAAQISIYAGGITVMYVFAIQARVKRYPAEPCVPLQGRSSCAGSTHLSGGPCRSCRYLVEKQVHRCCYDDG